MEKRLELEMRGRPHNQITELILDNCRSTNIVGLTSDFSSLLKLSLINVGLVTLKGFPKLPKLKKLELSDNRISNGLSYLIESCPNITNLNLSGNRLKDLEALKPLEKFSQLEVLDLFNNEATSVDNYREKLFAMIPSLKYLDGFDLKDGEAPSDGEDDEEANGFNGSDGGEDESEDDESGDDEVSLSEVFNEELDDDSSEWDEDGVGGAGEEEDDDIDDEESDEEADEKSATVAGKKRESTSDAPATKSVDKDNEDSEDDDDESQSRGKKRKHDD